MTEPSDNRLKIKKYANRRFYDASRSTHVTLSEMRDLICEGFDLQIIDSKTDEDITNIVLTQIILEHDPPKLDLFPSAILHQVIRTQQQFLGSVMEDFFRQWLDTQRASQQRWMNLMGSLFRAPTPGAGHPSVPPTSAPEGATSVFDPWGVSRQWWEAMASGAPRSTSSEEVPTEPSPTADDRAETIDALRRQLEALRAQVDRLTADDPSNDT